MDKLNLLKLFITVVDRGSFASASSALGLSPSTVSKAIARLESDLKLYLFHRTTRQLTLTEAGTAYLETVRKLLAELEQCENQLVQSNDAPQGRLRINAPVSYGRRYLLPLLGEFHRQYPHITVDLSFDDAYVDMIEQGIDICIRSGSLDESSMIAKQLSPMDFITCASPDYLETLKNAPSISEDDYYDHPWIRFRFKQTGKLMPILVNQPEHALARSPGEDFIVDDGEAMAQLCAQGLGLTQMPHFLARDWLNSGELVPVTPFVRGKGFGVWMVYAQRQFQPAKIRAFLNFMSTQIEARGETQFKTWAEDLRIHSNDTSSN